MITIFEKPIDFHNATVGKIAILRCGSSEGNPTEVINAAVKKYVGVKGYNEFVEIYLDNPWIRVVVGGINEFDFVEFTDQKL